jgi:TonB family protein
MTQSRSFQRSSSGRDKKYWIIIIAIALVMHVAFFLFFNIDYLRIFESDIPGEEGHSFLPALDRPFSLVILPDEAKKQISTEVVAARDENETERVVVSEVGEPPSELVPLTGGSSGGSDGRPGARRAMVEPKPLFIPWPKYPEGVDGPVEGKVELLLFVDEKGEVREVKLSRGLPQMILNRIAIEAAHNIRFTPGMEKGLPASMWVRLTIGFQPR